MVIIEHIKTWSKTLILSKVKTVKLFNLSKTSTALILVYMPLVVIYTLKFILVKTINRFSVRWNTHRHIWNNNTLDSEKAALSIHYHKIHNDFSYKNKAISECYTVTFLQQPSNSYLDICESRRIHLLDSSINIQATVLPIQR